MTDWSEHLLAAKDHLAKAEQALLQQTWTRAAIELGQAQHRLDQMWDWIDAKQPQLKVVDNLGGKAS